MPYTIFDFLGNVGVGLIIISYLLLQLGRIQSSSLNFSLSNALGALLVIISLTQQFNLSAFIVEAFWLLISIAGILKNLAGNRQKS